MAYGLEIGLQTYSNKNFGDGTHFWHPSHMQANEAITSSAKNIKSALFTYIKAFTLHAESLHTSNPPYMYYYNHALIIIVLLK